MYEFSLLKSLFFEMDPHKMKGVTRETEGQRTFHRMEVSYESVPQITSITAEERILPYVDRYYLFVNDERVPVDIRQPEIKQVIYEFYKEHFPEYLKKDLPENLDNIDILDCFEVFHMPDYRPKHAFPGLVTLEDIKKGNVHDEYKPQYAFPGLELFSKRKAEGEEEKPMVASYEGYTAFEGDREQAKNKIEQLKLQFSEQIETLKIEETLEKNLEKGHQEE